MKIILHIDLVSHLHGSVLCLVKIDPPKPKGSHLLGSIVACSFSTL
jgi:hypothetical protein